MIFLSFRVVEWDIAKKKKKKKKKEKRKKEKVIR
jgi:hypothetical protein